MVEITVNRIVARILAGDTNIGEPYHGKNLPELKVGQYRKVYDKYIFRVLEKDISGCYGVKTSALQVVPSCICGEVVYGDECPYCKLPQNEEEELERDRDM